MILQHRNKKKNKAVAVLMYMKERQGKPKISKIYNTLLRFNLKVLKLIKSSFKIEENDSKKETQKHV